MNLIYERPDYAAIAKRLEALNEQILAAASFEPLHAAWLAGQSGQACGVGSGFAARGKRKLSYLKKFQNRRIIKVRPLRHKNRTEEMEIWKKDANRGLR